MQNTEGRAATSAAMIREQSEGAIRAQAAATRTAVSDFGRHPTPEQRRDALLTLAESVANEQGHACQPISQVLPLIVPTLAAASVMNVLAEFDELVSAVVERSRFVGDPGSWLMGNGLPLTPSVYETHDEATLAAVDQCLDALMGAQR